MSPKVAVIIHIGDKACACIKVKSEYSKIK